MVEVRPASASDAQAVSRLAARTFALACPDSTPAAAIAEHIRTQLNADAFAQLMTWARFLVVDGAHGEVSGYVMLTCEPPPLDTHWQRPLELRRIYVDVDLHGRGVAEALMAASLRIAVEEGHDWIWLGTNKQNVRAIRFYEKAGFGIVGERKFCVADSVETDHVMARRVSLSHE